MHAGFGRHAVDDIQRVVVVERTDTADTYRSGTRRTTVGGDVHTRHLALQRLHRVVLLLLLQIGSGDGGDGTRQVGLALGGITRHHQLLQHLVVLRKGDLQVLSGMKLLGLVTHIRNYHHGIFRHSERELTIEIGDRSVGRTFLYHRGADDRLTRSGIRDDTRSRHLRVRRYGAEDCHEKGQE